MFSPFAPPAARRPQLWFVLALHLLGGCATPPPTTPATSAASAASAPHLHASVATQPAPTAATTRETPAPARRPQPTVPGTGRDAFVLLSGGGTPTSNNYSQYLQARAIASSWLQSYPREAVWIFFGQGNREGERPLLADVYRQVKRDSLLLDTWLPGALPENRVASKENFLRTLRAEILPRVRDGGTLYLFVGDHGELTRGKNGQSAITMWGLKRDPAHANGWSPVRDDALTVAELRAALAEGLGSGRVVFAMTQCHSGGFHDLGVPADVQPPRAWFATPPAWLGAAPKRLPLAAGFTATDAASIAAGCDPDPDPETWAGYERFFPEQLLGYNVAIPPPNAPARADAPRSFATAHVGATLADHTIDKPRSSAEQFLERWATLIETRLARELLIDPRVRSAVAAYHAAVENGRPVATDAAWRETQAQFAQFTARMIEQNSSVRRLLLAGNRSRLESAADARAAHAASHDADDDEAEITLTRAQLQTWRQVLRPAWTKAVAAGEVPELPAAAAEFERRLQSAETRGRPHGFSDAWSDRGLSELYWSSTYATPETFDAATAEAVSRWAATRRATILAWAARSPEPAVREAAVDFPSAFRRPRTAPPAPKSFAIPARTAAERTLFYRRVLAAWAFLLAVDHQPALQQLQQLRDLERTPLPDRATN